MEIYKQLRSLQERLNRASVKADILDGQKPQCVQYQPRAGVDCLKAT